MNRPLFALAILVTCLFLLTERPVVADARANACFGGNVQHVIYLVFDNTHFRRDNANVPSDLEQMPHLLNFLTSNGTLFTNNHTIVISHTGGGILSSLTGLYPDRTGQPVSNSYRYFTGAGASGTNSSASFKYWTDLVDDTGSPATDARYNMITETGKNTPAPWVPFTRAGCDVGAVAAANIVLENTGTGPHGDISQVFGNPSPQADEAASNSALAQADFVGIAVHCASVGSICDNNQSARGDLLPDEPGGYTGFKALFGAKYVNPAISSGNPCVDDTTGAAIRDPNGACGFPGFDGMSAATTLGYVAQMQEAGIPVTYAYISDAHDAHPTGPAYGPGEAGYAAALKQYDDAFAAFFTRLERHGINRANSLFVVTADEGDHFAGGLGTAQPDGSLAYAHSDCADMSICPSNQVGEVNLNLQTLLDEPGIIFTAHSDSAPAIYAADAETKAPLSPSDPRVLKLARDLAKTAFVDPYVGQSPVPLMERVADPIEMKALHMITSDPQKTPTLTLFGNPDLFMFASPAGPACPSAVANPCVDYHFAWSHGDIQDEIANTWVGFVGPGVAQRGIDAATWTDHANDRPTILSVSGLKDDYVQDGRVLIEALSSQPVQAATLVKLGALYEQINAPFGPFASNTLAAATKAITGENGAYIAFRSKLTALINDRDRLAPSIRNQLYGASFNGDGLDPAETSTEIDIGNELISRAKSLSAN